MLGTSAHAEHVCCARLRMLSMSPRASAWRNSDVRRAGRGVLAHARSGRGGTDIRTLAPTFAPTFARRPAQRIRWSGRDGTDIRTDFRRSTSANTSVLFVAWGRGTVHGDYYCAPGSFGSGSFGGGGPGSFSGGAPGSYGFGNFNSGSFSRGFPGSFVFSNFSSGSFSGGAPGSFAPGSFALASNPCRPLRQLELPAPR